MDFVISRDFWRFRVRLSRSPHLLAVLAVLGPSILSAGIQYSVGLESLVGRSSVYNTFSDFSVRVGSFSPGFSPTSENYSQWLPNFKPLMPAQDLILDRASFLSVSGSDSGPWIGRQRTITIHEGQDTPGISAGDSLFVWIANTTSLTGATEATLLSDPGWIYEKASEEPHPGITLVLRSATVEVALGSVFNVAFTDLNGESGIRLVTSPVGNVVRLDGIHRVVRNLSPGSRHLLNFEVTGLKLVRFNARGGVPLRWELYDGSYNLIASSDLYGDFEFARTLASGVYTLVLLSGAQAGSGGPETYDLELNGSENATLRPDIAVGRSPFRLLGAGVYAVRSGQTVELLSRRSRTVTGFFTATNRGNTFGSLLLNGSRGSRLFRVNYHATVGNISGRIVGVGYETSWMAPLDPPEIVRVVIQPNRAALKKRVRDRWVIDRRSLSVSIRATSSLDPSSMDTGWINVKTR